MSVADRYFDDLFQHSDDPWAFKERWYERRKRALTLAALPRERYGSVFEPGCANGELSAELAPRCDALLCCDTCLPAVELARQRLSGFRHAKVLHGRLPEQWPEGRFDLIVLSEVCYYLDSADLHQLIDKALAALTADGQLLACHWRPSIEGCPQDAAQVHTILEQRLPMAHLFAYRDEDMLLDLWGHDATSVASRERLR